MLAYSSLFRDIRYLYNVWGMFLNVVLLLNCVCVMCVHVDKLFI